MDKNRITVVTGDPRSGTSMLMQCFDLAGVPFAGSPIVRDYFRKNERKPARWKFKNKQVTVIRKNLKSRTRRVQTVIEKLTKDRSHRLNPKGFYEIPGVVIRGIQRLNKTVQGKVVKIIAGGVWDRQLPDGRFVGTPPNIVAKYILCLRHPRSVIESQKSLITNVFSSLQEDDDDADADNWNFAPRPLSATAYLLRMGGLLVWLNDQTQSVVDKFLPVQFDDMLFKTSQTLAAVFDHIGHTPATYRMSLAVGNISAKLRRSVTLVEWPKDLEEAGQLAETIYGAFSSMDRTEISSAAAKMTEYSRSFMYEAVTWVDDEDTWATIKPEAKRKILNNTKGLADVLRSNRDRYRHTSLICDQCDYYIRDPDNTYTVDRPEDLGPLVRSMVMCGRDGTYRTVEECKACWQRGSIINGEFKEAQRLIQLGVK